MTALTSREESMERKAKERMSGYAIELKQGKITGDERDEEFEKF